MSTASVRGWSARWSGLFKSLSLLALRVTTGLLLVWWGLAKTINPDFGQLVADNFYGGLFSTALLFRIFGLAQMALGLAVVAGYWRRLALWAQLAINVFTAAAVWYALVDPFHYFLPGDKPMPFSHLFYPSAIIVAACLVLIAFRDQDRFAIDNRLA